MNDIHAKFMKRALVLAKRGFGNTSPNPAVGCLIVRDGRIVGEGWHRKAGTPHAEAHALAMAGEAARGADVYVTLEPCSHFGKTPPCADALIAAGVGRVFAAMVDPNPKVSGRGIGKLENAGIGVRIGLLEKESRTLNEPFIKHVITGTPFVTLKSAMTLDGKTATVSGDSKWITNDKSRYYVHKLRSSVDAVMVGIGTVRTDDPQLTARIPGGKDPLRVIVDSGLNVPLHAQVLRVASPARTVIATLETEGAKAETLRGFGVELIGCRERDGRVDLADLCARLGAMGVQSLLLEGGSRLAGEFVRAGLIDKFLLFYAPKIVGGEAPGLFAGASPAHMANVLRLKDLRFRRFGADFMIEGYPEDSCLPD
jgi:diaminohydroxyphosphoribosylaminopyrimidine deaminase / 5-amino-6-(5-phosphoribosylamino)uracil reductase